MSAPWDNATEETQALERQEDADAARDELRTAMGATLPAGMLGNGSQSRRGEPSPSVGSSHRPTLLLLGLDLPASVRDGVRAELDRDAPELFGCHIVGADALPSLASAAQTAPGGGRGFLGPCREPGVKHISPHSTKLESENKLAGNSTKEGVSKSGVWAVPADGESGRGGPTGRNGGASEHEMVSPTTRANLVQAVLSEGKNVSLEVVPGPGLWARGRFLRDLEALLGGLDGCGGHGEDISTKKNERKGPMVLLVDGHRSNRSGGGTDLSHGTKYMGKAIASQREGVKGDCVRSSASRSLKQNSSALPSALLNSRRVKALLEGASQCLHDLSTMYGETPSPFKAIAAASGASPTSHTLRESHNEQWEGSTKSGAPSNLLDSSPTTRTDHGQTNVSLSAKGSPGMEMLLAACHMMRYPNRRYDVGENQVGSSSNKADASAENSTKTHATANSDSGLILLPSDMVADDHVATLEYASGLAETCRKELAEQSSARGVAEILRGAAVNSLPLETAVALRRLGRHPDWPRTSPRSDFPECPASEAFTAWIVAAVAGGTDLALEGGGGEPGDGVGSNLGPPSTREEWSGMTKVPGACGGITGAEEVMDVGSVSDALPPVMDAQAEREQERELLRGMEEALIDEKFTVLDDDSPWLLPSRSTEESGTVQDPRLCRTSEVLNSLMEISLRPFTVSLGPSLSHENISSFLFHTPTRFNLLPLTPEAS